MVNECQTSQLCIISNVHVILHVSHLIKLPVSCGELPNLSRHPLLNNPPHSGNVITLFAELIVNALFLHQLAGVVPSGILHIRPNTQASPQRDPTHWAQLRMHRMACLVPASAGTRYCCRLGPITWPNNSININR